MRGLFAEVNARIYLAGQTVSLIGDRMLWLAMGIWIKSLTGSNGAAGLSFFFFIFPSLFAPLCGSLVDRLPRRTLLLWTNLATAGVVASLVLVHGRGMVWLIYLVMFLYGASYNILGAGGAALLRGLVRDDQLGDANAYLSTVTEGCRLFAPLAGAGLYVVIGGGALGLIDAASFLVAAGSLMLIRVPELPPEFHDESWRQYTAAGIRHLWNSVPLRQITLATAVTLLVVGFLESVGFAVVSQGLHRHPSFNGVLVSVEGVGAIPAALSAGRLMRRCGAGRMMAIGLIVAAVGCLGLTQSRLGPVLVGEALFGAGLPWIIVGFGTALGRLTPLALQGRVNACANFLIGTPQTVSIALGAGLVGWVDYRLLLLVIAAVTLAAGLYLASRPELGRDALEAAVLPTGLERLEELGEAPVRETAVSSPGA